MKQMSERLSDEALDNLMGPDSSVPCENCGGRATDRYRVDDALPRVVAEVRAHRAAEKRRAEGLSEEDWHEIERSKIFLNGDSAPDNPHLAIHIGVDLLAIIDCLTAALADNQAAYAKLDARIDEMIAMGEKQEAELDRVKGLARGLRTALRALLTDAESRDPCWCAGASPDCPYPPPCEACAARETLIASAEFAREEEKT